MRRPRIKIDPPRVLESGWTVWHRAPEGIICCDCALAHDTEWRVTPTGRISVRVRRNEEVTERLRKGAK